MAAEVGEMEGLVRAVSRENKMGVLEEELVGSGLGSVRNNSVAPVRLLPDTSLI